MSSDTIHGIESVIGRESFEALCLKYGGLDLHIPQSMDSQSAHYLADTIGLEATKVLIDWGQSSRIYVPRLAEIERSRRRDEVHALRRTGMSVARIAREYRFQSRYTERQVIKMLCCETGVKAPDSNRIIATIPAPNLSHRKQLSPR